MLAGFMNCPQNPSPLGNSPVSNTHHARQHLQAAERSGTVLLLASSSMCKSTLAALVMHTPHTMMRPDMRLERFLVPCSIREQRRSVTVLLAGTSGTGKSTLAGLLAARLGISTVLSTDSVRHMLRSFTPQASNPVLWASTYEVSAALYWAV